MIERAADGAGLELKAHPHMLRHACGYALANKGHDTRAIQGWLSPTGRSPAQGCTRRWRRTGLRTSSGEKFWPSRLRDAYLRDGDAMARSQL
jgi:integrase